jgi:uncharacterized membrane protein (Fun14 family)
MASEAIFPLAATVGGGFLSGILLGYFVKKVIKILMFILGGIITVLLLLQYQGVITINMSKLESSLLWLMNSLSSLSLQLSNTTDVGILTVPLTSSISAGFILGFLKS